MLSFDIWVLPRRFSVKNSKFFSSSLLPFGSEHCFEKKKCIRKIYNIKYIKKYIFSSKINNKYIIMQYKGNARNVYIT